MFGDTPLHFVDSAESLERMVEALSKAPVIGVDTESDSFHHYREKVCLIQFSDLDNDYILDPLAIDDISSVGAVFADPDIVKIFHGADYDVVCMKRDFGFDFHNLFDTMIAAQMIGAPRVGLADLIGRYFGHTIDKQYQRHDWAKRPLLDEHIQYARGDTHFLLALREILIRRLKRVKRLGHVEEECEILEEREWEGRTPDPLQWLRTKGSSHLSDRDKLVLKHLWQYRDAEAKKADRPPFKVLPDPVLVKAAERHPTSERELEKLFPRKTAMRRRYGAGMVDAVEAGLEDDGPVPTRKPRKKPRKGPPARLTGRTAERALAGLKDWRNDLMRKDPGLSPVTIASNAVLRQIVAARPTDLDGLRAVRDVRRWQVKDYGEQILAVLDEVAPWPPPETSDDDDTPAPKRKRRRRRRKPKSDTDSAAEGPAAAGE